MRDIHLSSPVAVLKTKHLSSGATVRLGRRADVFDFGPADKCNQAVPILPVYLFGNNNDAKKFCITVPATRIVTTVWDESWLNGLFAGVAARLRFYGFCQPWRVRWQRPA